MFKRMRRSTLFVVKDSTGRTRSLPHSKAVADKIAARIELDTLLWYNQNRPRMGDKDLMDASMTRVVPA